MMNVPKSPFAVIAGCGRIVCQERSLTVAAPHLAKAARRHFGAARQHIGAARVSKRFSAFFSILLIWLALSPAIASDAKEKQGKATAPHGPAIMWTNPGDIETRDLFYGSGGSSHEPHAPFTFVKEDPGGSTPKFVVKDRDGVKWKVKMGNEARPETVAARIVWAVGYYTDEDYFVADLPVRGMPVRLHRGHKLVDPDGTVHNVRLEREHPAEKRLGDWRWRHDAFTDTRELNGLRTLMAVINNWDPKDVNNAIYQEADQRVYLVADLGATFGSAGRTWPMDKSKGDLETYKKSAFIRRVTSDTVDFQTPARPRYIFAVNPKGYLMRVHLEWIGRNIPRADAKWIGSLLARLSPKQIHDAFRAAGYSSSEVDEFSSIVARRIAQLTDL